VVGEVENMLRHFSDECCDRNQREAKVFLKEWTIMNCMKKNPENSGGWITDEHLKQMDQINQPCGSCSGNYACNKARTRLMPINEF
jgi:hypothetical protein